MGRKVYVGNLSYKATEDDLSRLFSTVGEVKSVKIIMDMNTGHKKGFGFIEMSSTEEAQKAMTDLNGVTLLERNLIVNEAKEKKAQRKGKGRQFGRRNTGQDRPHQ